MGEIGVTPAPAAPEGTPLLQKARHLFAEGGPLALALLVLSAVSKILEFLKNVGESRNLIRFDQFSPYVEWIVAGLVIAGYALAGIFFYRKFKARFKLHKLLAGFIIAAALGTVLALNLVLIERFVHKVPPVSSEIAKLEASWSRQLLDTEKVGNSGGFNTFQSCGPGDPDVWTSAQALNAILRGPSHGGLADNVRRAFDFIRTNIKDAGAGGRGWVTRPSSTWPRTEITAWVALAEMASLRAGDVWAGPEVPKVVAEVEALLTDIQKRQNSKTGAWGPTVPQIVPATNEPRSDDDRTYSTVMALWSLIEARRTKPVSDAIGPRFDSALRSGIAALMRIPHTAGWAGSPWGSETHVGLTAQALYVLSLVRDAPAVFSTIDLDDFNKTREAFLNSFALEPNLFKRVSDRLSGPEQHITGRDGKEIEEAFYVTFFPYPWSIALFGHMANDTSLPHGLRSTASQLCYKLEQELEAKDVGPYFQRVETYQLAENLIGIASSAGP